MFEMDIQITGDRQVVSMLNDLPIAAQNRVLKPLIRDGSRMLADSIEAQAPEESGLLKQAVGPSSLKQYGWGTLWITAGVRRGFKRAVMANRRGRFVRKGKKASEAAGDALQRNPTKYLHLVTGGRKAISATNKKSLYSAQAGRFFGKSVAAATPNPFVDRAFSATKDRVADMIASKATDMIVAEAAALAGG